MTLSFYIARRFLRAFGIVGGAFAGILFLINLAELARRLSGDDYGIGALSRFALLKLPQTLYEILPLVMVLSAVTLFIGLARTSELVVIRAAGRSALRMLVAPVLVAFAIGLVAVTMGNPIVSATKNRYEQLMAERKSETRSTISIGREGVWMRQGAGLAADGETLAQAVIQAASANADATRLRDVTFLIFVPGQGPVRRLRAAEAELVPGAWALTDVKDWNLGGSTNPEYEASRHDSLRIASDLTAARIRESFGEPEDVALWQLPGFIASLDAAGFSSLRHRVWFLSELSLPIFLGAMVLVAAAFTMRHARSGRMGMMVLLAFGLGLGMFFLRYVAQILGGNGQVPLMLAAWAPPLIAVIVPLAFVLHLEDG